MIVLLFVASHALVLTSILAGSAIGGAALWLVHREVTEMGGRIDYQDQRIAQIESLVKRIEGRWSASQ